MRRKTAVKNELLAKATNAPVRTEDLHALQTQIENNPLYALEVDPDGSLGMNETEKEFTKWYVQHRNIPVAAQLAGINNDEGIAIYRKMSFQSELRRISNAIQIRQINQSTMTVDEIGSMLTSFVLDKVPEVDRLDTKQKMEAMRLLLDINELKTNMVEDPKVVEVIEVKEQLKDMSVEAIKALLEQGKKMDSENNEKEKIIEELDKDSTLTNEDLRYLRSLSSDQLKDMLNDQVKILHDD